MACIWYAIIRKQARSTGEDSLTLHPRTMCLTSQSLTVQKALSSAARPDTTTQELKDGRLPISATSARRCICA
eukprot:3986401-Karenia_brevis.AAC.1